MTAEEGKAGVDRHPTDAEWDANEQGWKAGLRKAMRMARARAGALSARALRRGSRNSVWICSVWKPGEQDQHKMLLKLANDYQKVINKEYD